MIISYFKIGWRNIGKNKAYSLISIIGLTLGLSSFLLIYTVVFDELSYDRFWEKSKELYRANQTNTLNDVETKMPGTPKALGTELKEKFPEVEAFSPVDRGSLQIRGETLIEQPFSIDILSVDTSFLTMFNIKEIGGKPVSFIVGSRNLVITEALRNKYFGNENPVGKIIYNVSSGFEEPDPYLITAVVNDIPQNTHLRTEALVVNAPKPQYLVKGRGFLLTTVYYQLKKGTDVSLFSEKVNKWYANHMEEKVASTKFSFQPIQDVYLNSDFDTNQKIKNKKVNLIIFSAIGILLLVIGCINFINLTTAKALQRLKETGIRKVLGADRNTLIKQFLTESFLFFSIAAITAIVLYFIMLPATERFIGHGLTYTLQSKWLFMLSTIFGICILSAATGIYPAWVLSGLQPSDTLRNRLTRSSFLGAEQLRKGLVVVQFVIAIAVLLLLIVIDNQMRFINHKGLGYDKENLLYIKPFGQFMKMSVLKAELNKIPGVLSVGASQWNPTDGFFGKTRIKNPKNPTEDISLQIIVSDLDFAKTAGLKFLKGRYPSEEYGTDRNDINNFDRKKKSITPDGTQTRQLVNVLITRHTAQLLDVTEINTPIPGTDMNPIGIIEDFHVQSLHHSLDPMAIMVWENLDGDGIYIRTEAGKEKDVLDGLNAVWAKLIPGKPMEGLWVDESLQQLYDSEYKQQTLISVFGSIMLILSSLGVLGLIIQSTEQRTKEIGIRKVMGASVTQITVMLSRNFLGLVIIAMLIASPTAWWVMNKWLEDFAYRTEIKWWMFVLAGGMAILVALITVSFQTIKAALANPVKSLRSE
jgi:putative ABC transport system permease protein